MTRLRRTVPVLHACLGFGMAVRPQLAARALGEPGGGRHLVLRLLALRHLAQAAWCWRRPGRASELGSLALDGSHAASCVALGILSRQHRRAAWRDGAVASGLLIASVLARSRPTAPQPPAYGPVSGARLVLPAGGSVAAGSPQALGAEASVPLRAGALVIGSDRGCDLRVDDPQVAPAHAKVMHDIDGQARGRTRLQDLGAPGGTFVNGIPVREAQLSDGDRIEVGSTALVYRDDTSELS